jgi:SAM-dependent methyltransferase
MGTKKYETNIKYQFYWKSLNNLKSYISYYNQLNEIHNTHPKTVLEIGVGNKLVYNHLKEIGIKVTSLDINKNLKPDYIGDIRKLPFKNNSFDTVCAFEVLEHIPFEDFENSLKELKRVSKKNVIISIPIITKNIEFYLYLPKLHDIYFHLDIPYKIKQKKNITDKDAHYWEVNRIGYSKKRILNIIKKHFTVKKEFRPRFNKSHWFLVLEK